MILLIDSAPFKETNSFITCELSHFVTSYLARHVTSLMNLTCDKRVKKLLRSSSFDSFNLLDDWIHGENGRSARHVYFLWLHLYLVCCVSLQIRAGNSWQNLPRFRTGEKVMDLICCN